MYLSENMVMEQFDTSYSSLGLSVAKIHVVFYVYRPNFSIIFLLIRKVLLIFIKQKKKKKKKKKNQMTHIL